MTTSEFRERFNLNQSETAKILGLGSGKRISEIENGGNVSRGVKTTLAIISHTLGYKNGRKIVEGYIKKELKDES